MPTSPEYYQKNKEEICKKNSEYYQSNKEARLAWHKEYRKKNRLIITQKQKIKRQQRVEQAIELLGGCCAHCGGIYPPYVYDFHHKNPEEKEFTISEQMLVSTERFQKEISKCILLCANCHRKEHNKDYNAPEQI